MLEGKHRRFRISHIQGQAYGSFLQQPLYFAPIEVKNPVLEHGASSMEKAIYLWGLIANGRRWSANGRRWSAPKPRLPFIPARERESGAFWLFHVK